MMAKLIDMKRPKTKKSLISGVPEESYEKYGYGLRINLDSDDIKKLGDQVSGLKVAGKATISAEVLVVNINVAESLRDSGKESTASAELQITKLAIEKVSSAKGDNSLRAVKQRLRKGI